MKKVMLPGMETRSAPKIPPHDKPRQARREAPAAKGGHGTALPPNNTPLNGARPSRTAPKAHGGMGKSAMPPMSGPGHISGGDTAKTSHSKEMRKGGNY